jgi:hypothetical protein
MEPLARNFLILKTLQSSARFRDLEEAIRSAASNQRTVGGLRNRRPAPDLCPI